MARPFESARLALKPFGLNVVSVFLGPERIQPFKASRAADLEEAEVHAEGSFPHAHFVAIDWGYAHRSTTIK